MQHTAKPYSAKFPNYFWLSSIWKLYTKIQYNRRVKCERRCEQLYIPAKPTLHTPSSVEVYIWKTHICTATNIVQNAHLCGWSLFAFSRLYIADATNISGFHNPNIICRNANPICHASFTAEWSGWVERIGIWGKHFLSLFRHKWTLPIWTVLKGYCWWSSNLCRNILLERKLVFNTHLLG